MEDKVVWAEINLRAISHNIKEIKRLISQKTKVMAVVKANGYGHGAQEVARIVLKEGGFCLAVARLEEGIFLRQSGIVAPILIFGPVLKTQLKLAIENDFILTIHTLEQAITYSKFACINGVEIKCYLKVDTGMGRLGFVVDKLSTDISCFEDIFRLFKLPGICIHGIYTHFACADEEDLSYSYLQLKRFNFLIQELDKKGICDLLLHAANSAAIVQLPESHLDMVRPGIMLYGLYPSEHIKKQHKVNLIPAMSLKAKIVQIKRVEKGFKVSYGSTYVTKKSGLLATIPIGYADGYPRILSSKGKVLVKGCLAPIVGRVCMDQMVVDITGIDANVGDEVLIFGKDDYGELSADRVAYWANTINYEIVSSITSRVPRIYKR